jgi:hypothetical protein
MNLIEPPIEFSEVDIYYNFAFDLGEWLNGLTQPVVF